MYWVIGFGSECWQTKPQTGYRLDVASSLYRKRHIPHTLTNGIRWLTSSLYSCLQCDEADLCSIVDVAVGTHVDHSSHWKESCILEARGMPAGPQVAFFVKRTFDVLMMLFLTQR